MVRSESIRSVIALAAKHELVLHQMAVKCAFLNGTLEEEVYMKQPPGFIEKGQEHLVCKLKKSIYGLKQSSRCWNATLNDNLCRLGFTQSPNDPCLYVSEGELAIVGVHVDDLIIAAETEERVNEIKGGIASKFAVKDLGELNYMLAIEVDQQSDPDAILIGQGN